MKIYGWANSAPITFLNEQLLLSRQKLDTFLEDKVLQELKFSKNVNNMLQTWYTSMKIWMILDIKILLWKSESEYVVCIKKKNLLIYVYLHCARRLSWSNPPQPSTLYLRCTSLYFHYLIISQGNFYFTGIFNT